MNKQTKYMRVKCFSLGQGLQEMFKKDMSGRRLRSDKGQSFQLPKKSVITYPAIHLILRTSVLTGWAGFGTV